MDLMTSVEASVFRYLYENIEIVHGVKVFEDVYSQDFENFSEWVVVDSLAGNLGAEPLQHYFFHVCQQKNGQAAKEALIRLQDKVNSLFELGNELPLYDYDTGVEVGTMRMSNVAAWSPVLQHKGGGSTRALPVTITFQGIGEE